MILVGLALTAIVIAMMANDAFGAGGYFAVMIAFICAVGWLYRPDPHSW